MPKLPVPIKTSQKRLMPVTIKTLIHDKRVLIGLLCIAIKAWSCPHRDTRKQQRRLEFFRSMQTRQCSIILSPVLYWSTFMMCRVETRSVYLIVLLVQIRSIRPPCISPSVIKVVTIDTERVLTVHTIHHIIFEIIYPFKDYDYIKINLRIGYTSFDIWKT